VFGIVQSMMRQQHKSPTQFEKENCEAYNRIKLSLIQSENIQFSYILINYPIFKLFIQIKLLNL